MGIKDLICKLPPFRQIKAMLDERMALHRKEMVCWSNLNEAVEDGTLTKDDLDSVSVRLDAVSMKPGTKAKVKK